ncbi:MAG: UDP-N-acetylglucosamine 1-carboxyvinyltransferase [Erysipelotrichaceae bacterium]|nr:UDP-N-acetylglucosamine 1-carboxyvinyltransferase [Erysipelotrichaceae bacterium]
MSDKITIRGGRTLSGEVTISSSKNAAVAILPAVVLASEVVKLYEVPNIEDIKVLIKLLGLLNIKVTMEDDALTIDPTRINNVVLDDPAVNKLRASYYFMGAILGRFKHVKMLYPGGCNLGPRPIDLHLKGFESLGATVVQEDGQIEIFADRLIGDDIYLDIASVGATVNIMLAAVFAEGRTTIKNAAKEPEIIDLSSMLNKMGAIIRGAGTSEITIDGVKRLKGCIHDIIPDRIEAGTYIIMAAACGDHVLINNVIPHHLGSLLAKLEEMGVQMDVGIDFVRVLSAENLKAVDVETLPFPGFATDLQQPLTSLMTKAKGNSQVKETLYRQRFKHCKELNKMGADIEVNEVDGSSLVHGGTPLHGTEVTATDLRCGAALIIAALMADGETVIDDAYHIYRGYDSIIEKLRKLGADAE